MTEPSFRNSSNARYLKGLFFETTTTPDTAVYTLKDKDHQGYPSLYRRYMDAADDTEYLFATANLDGWEHWEMLCKCNWFEPIVTRWRKELYLQKTAKILKSIEAEAGNPNSKNHFVANKLLLDREWEGKVPKGKRGRPSKEEVAGELKREAADARRQQADLARILDIGQARQGNSEADIQGGP